MSEATDEPTSARGLADILREAGISAAGAGGRRRRRDEADPEPLDDHTTAASPAHSYEDVYAGDTFGPASDRDFFGTHPRIAADESPAQYSGTEVGGLSDYFRTRSEVASPEQTTPHRTPPAAKTPAPKTPAPKPPAPKPPAPKPPDRVAARQPPYRTDTGPVPTAGWSSLGTGWPESSAKTSGATAATSTSTATGSSAASAAGESTSPATLHANRSASPVATAAPTEDDTDAAQPPRGGVASWAILAVELLAALGLGVAAWYAFSAVWELLPYVAAFAGPLVVTGLVAVAGALRARTGRNPLGLPTLCILVFAGTVLVVLPAATVIIP